jgi:two-component system chemotaxis response regulator CheY
MVSAMGQQSMVIDAIKMGAKDLIVKPFDKTRVQQAIENVLKML